MNFRVGDRVILIDDNNVAATLGATATVTGDPSVYGTQYIQVKWDRNDLDGGQRDGSYCRTAFKLIDNHSKRAEKGHFNKVEYTTVKIEPGMQFKKNGDDSTVYFVNNKWQMMRISRRQSEVEIVDVRESALSDITWQLVDSAR